MIFCIYLVINTSKLIFKLNVTCFCNYLKMNYAKYFKQIMRINSLHCITFEIFKNNIQFCFYLSLFLCSSQSEKSSEEFMHESPEVFERYVLENTKDYFVNLKEIHKKVHQKTKVDGNLFRDYILKQKEFLNKLHVIMRECIKIAKIDFERCRQLKKNKSLSFTHRKNKNLLDSEENETIIALFDSILDIINTNCFVSNALYETSLDQTELSKFMPFEISFVCLNNMLECYTTNILSLSVICIKMVNIRKFKPDTIFVNSQEIVQRHIVFYSKSTIGLFLFFNRTTHFENIDLGQGVIIVSNDYKPGEIKSLIESAFLFSNNTKENKLRKIIFHLYEYSRRKESEYCCQITNSQICTCLIDVSEEIQKHTLEISNTPNLRITPYIIGQINLFLIFNSLFEIKNSNFTSKFILDYYKSEFKATTDKINKKLEKKYIVFFRENLGLSVEIATNLFLELEKPIEIPENTLEQQKRCYYKKHIFDQLKSSLKILMVKLQDFKSEVTQNLNISVSVIDPEKYLVTLYYFLLVVFEKYLYTLQLTLLQITANPSGDKYFFPFNPVLIEKIIGLGTKIHNLKCLFPKKINERRSYNFTKISEIIPDQPLRDNAQFETIYKDLEWLLNEILFLELDTNINIFVERFESAFDEVDYILKG